MTEKTKSQGTNESLLAKELQSTQIYAYKYVFSQEDHSDIDSLSKHDLRSWTC